MPSGARKGQDGLSHSRKENLGKSCPRLANVSDPGGKTLARQGVKASN